MIINAFICTSLCVILIMLVIRHVAAALKLDAKAIILAHNHPSGDPTPSLQDRHLTETMKTIGTAVGVEVLDHLII